MTGAEIHNGEIIRDVSGVETERAPAEQRSGTPSDCDPEELSALLAREVSSWMMDSGTVYTPMDLVNRLLQLKDAKGQKVLFTRWDLFQCFAIWSKKLGGELQL